MVLGTVQLGKEYGIRNRSGKPTEKEAFRMLDYAYWNGVNTLDTANAYGDSEKVIGEYIKQSGHKFNVCTKLPVNISSGAIEDYLWQSLKLLNLEKIFVYYLHRFEQCKEKDILEELRALKASGLICNIGVSIYEPEELKYINENLSDIIDVVQLPFSLFDSSRWLESGELFRAEELEIQIFARSVFLQGLIFTELDSELAKKMKITKQLQIVKELSNDCKCSIAELAIAFIKEFRVICDYLVGCETIQQLKQNLEIDCLRIQLGQSTLEKIMELGKSLDIFTIDPRKWSD